MNIDKISNVSKPSIALTKAAASDLKSTPFNSFLENAIANKEVQQANMSSVMGSLGKLMQTNPEKAGAHFAQAMLESELDRDRKRVTKAQDAEKQLLRSGKLLETLGSADEVKPTDFVAQMPLNQDVVKQNNLINTDELFAQAPEAEFDIVPNEPVQLTSQNVNEEGLQGNRLDVTPFQLFMDKAVEALESLSEMEFRVNDLIDQYIQGKVSIEEVSTETAKLSMAISFATTVVTQMTTTFKEIQNMPV